ncbi:cdc18 Cell division control protein 18 [Candida maltosa Xu316]|uniref:Cell division control protein n=1 Tax=Candida maltosa (strain Xu316) TaxID=1245528 RepID=M3JBI6_CANMX|nr:hypothetical protein G210_5741 [Candida maltosa Xu316]
MSTTPSRKRTIRDISNTQYPLTPTKTPTKTKKIKLIDNVKPSCVKKLTFDIAPTPSPTTTPTTTIYSRAKALFQRGSNFNNYSLQLISREREAKHINDFISSSIQNRVSNSLYISGPPGTGKTAQVQLLLQPYEKVSSTRVVKINCMTLNNPESIFHEIYCKLVNRLSIGCHRRKTLDDFTTLLNDDENQNFSSVIVLLDELDSLLTKDQQVLFQLFKLANTQNITRTKINLVLIGISNTLDLSNTFLPKLIRNNLQLDNLQFLPYTSDQIKSIIVNKLSTLNEEIFHPGAIQFCCKKAASVSGDLRKAFDICYKSIELVEKNQGKVMIQHVAKICTTSFGSTENHMINLNLSQKAILCQLYNCQQSTEGKEISINNFYDFYKKQDEMNKLIGLLKYGEFIEILNALESIGCVVISNGKGNSNKNVKLNVLYDDILRSIENIGILKKIIN